MFSGQDFAVPFIYYGAKWRVVWRRSMVLMLVTGWDLVDLERWDVEKCMWIEVWMSPTDWWHLARDFPPQYLSLRQENLIVQIEDRRATKSDCMESQSDWGCEIGRPVWQTEFFCEFFFSIAMLRVYKMHGHARVETIWEDRSMGNSGVCIAMDFLAFLAPSIFSDAQIQIHHTQGGVLLTTARIERAM